MSTATSNRLSDLDEIIRKHGVEGIRTLLLFKLLKNKTKEILASKDSSKDITDNFVNLVCIEKAITLSKLGTQMPSQEDIKEILSKLSRTERY